jgi:hypothetical protein
LALLLLLAACAALGPRRVADLPAAGARDVKHWEGVWIEKWPDADQEDRYRITLTNDGFTIKVEPLTNVERQQLKDLSWDGATLKFTNVADGRPIYYSLQINDSGDRLAGEARSDEGDQSPIQWLKEGGASAVPSRRAETPARLERPSLDDWSGNWEESWPDRKERDAYRIVYRHKRLSVETLSNLDRQGVINLSWNGSRLSFVLRFEQNEIAYELFQLNRDTLVGLATMPDGSLRRVVWTRLGPEYDDSRPAFSDWGGTWKEFWPGRPENDLYQVTPGGRKELTIRPMTNTKRQAPAALLLENGELSFQLSYDQSAYVYRLRLDDPNTIRGTVRLPEGQTRELAWVRVAK